MACTAVNENYAKYSYKFDKLNLANGHCFGGKNSLKVKNWRAIITFDLFNPSQEE